MLQKFRLRQRILLGYLAPLVILLVAMGVVFVNLQTATRLSAERFHSQQVTFATQDAVLDLVKITRETRGYILFKSPVFRKGFESNLADYRIKMEKVKSIAIDPLQIETVKKLELTGDRLIQILQSEIDLVDAGKADEASQILAKQGIGESDELDSLWGNYESRTTEILQGLNASTDSSLETVKGSILYGMIAAALFAVVFAYWIASAVSRDITVNAVQLSAAASEIAATIEQHERTASQQAAAANETSATIEELSASSRQSAEQAANSAAVAERSSAATAQGSEATRQTVEAMAELRDKIGAMADQILHLAEQTGQIGSIATLLKDLAGQINMLALNAAVEAARAGEHGKGFAVVASEIRKLADQSKKSAEQTAVLVNDIQKTTNSSILMTEEGTRTVNEVTQLVRKVSDLFGNLASLAGSVNENAQQVMFNARQQSAAFGQIVDATNSIASGSKETAAGIGQTRIGVQKLNEAAGNLKAIL